MDHDDAVIHLPALQRSSLTALFQVEALAVVVPGYVDPELARSVGRKIAEDPGLEDHYYAPLAKGGQQRERVSLGVSRLGIAFNTVFGEAADGPKAQRYYAAALDHMRKIRAFFSPNLAPIDRLRLELDELWPEGANLGTFHGQKMSAGVPRVTHPDSELLETQPHVDSLPCELQLDGQYSANVYLSVPPEGGELLLWPSQVLTQEQIEAKQAMGETWNRPPGAAIAIRPSAGDLILINTRRFHAVRRFPRGARVSIQTFIGLRAGQPLRLWS
jgi:hypothetical protein